MCYRTVWQLFTSLDESERNDSVLDGSRPSETEQARNAAHFKALVRDGTLGSRSRFDGNQQIAGPQELYEKSSPEHVLKYLARYLTGGPISDRRLIGELDGRIAFWARAGDGSDKQIRVERTGVEFLRLWSLHILPKGFTKSRFFGGWSNNQRASFLDRCRTLRFLLSSAAQSDPLEPTKGTEEKKVREHACPRCNAAMELESSQLRPSWRVLFTGPEHPDWNEWMGSG